MRVERLRNRCVPNEPERRKARHEDRADRKYTSRIDNADSRAASVLTVCAQSNRGTRMGAGTSRMANEPKSLLQIDVTGGAIEVIGGAACRTS